MKKGILGGIGMLPVTAMVAWNVNVNSQNGNLPGVSLMNIEALGVSERGCVNRAPDNNGHCTNDGTYYFCENANYTFDCVKGEYP